MKRVRTLRQQKGWSQNKLSKITGVSQTTISAIENGERNKSYYTIKKIAAALGVTMDELGEGES